MANLLGVPLAMLTRFFNKEICINHKGQLYEEQHIYLNSFRVQG